MAALWASAVEKGANAKQRTKRQLNSRWNRYWKRKAVAAGIDWAKQEAACAYVQQELAKS